MLRHVCAFVAACLCFFSELIQLQNGRKAFALSGQKLLGLSEKLLLGRGKAFARSRHFCAFFQRLLLKNGRKAFALSGQMLRHVCAFVAACLCFFSELIQVQNGRKAFALSGQKLLGLSEKLLGLSEKLLLGCGIFVLFLSYSRFKMDEKLLL